MIGLLLWIVFGGLYGWLTGFVVKPGEQGVVGNVAVGVIGASLGGFLFIAHSPSATFNDTNCSIVVWAGATLMLAIVNVTQHVDAIVRLNRRNT